MMSNLGEKIIEGLKEAAAGDFFSVTIEGIRWVRAASIPAIPASILEEREACAKIADKYSRDAKGSGIRAKNIGLLIADAIRTRT